MKSNETRFNPEHSRQAEACRESWQAVTCQESQGTQAGEKCAASSKKRSALLGVVLVLVVGACAALLPGCALTSAHAIDAQQSHAGGLFAQRSNQTVVQPDGSTVQAGAGVTAQVNDVQGCSLRSLVQETCFQLAGMQANGHRTDRGFCVNYQDADGDGVCDTCGVFCQGAGAGAGSGSGYVDADGDGICDNRDTSARSGSTKGACERAGDSAGDGTTGHAHRQKGRK